MKALFQEKEQPEEKVQDEGDIIGFSDETFDSDEVIFLTAIV